MNVEQDLDIPAVWGEKEKQDPVVLLFFFLLLDLNVYTAIYLLSDFHDLCALETS